MYAIPLVKSGEPIVPCHKHELSPQEYKYPGKTVILFIKMKSVLLLIDDTVYFIVTSFNDTFENIATVFEMIYLFSAYVADLNSEKKIVAFCYVTKEVTFADLSVSYFIYACKLTKSRS